MLHIKCSRSVARIGVLTAEHFERSICEGFRASEEVLRSCLCITAVDPRRLIFKMEDEPHLDTRVRHSNLYPRSPRQINCLGHTRMLVHIEDAPILVIHPAATLLLIASVHPLPLDGLLNQLKWPATKAINCDHGGLPIDTMPPDEILLLGLETLNEHEKLPSDCPLRRSPTTNGSVASSTHGSRRVLNHRESSPRHRRSRAQTRSEWHRICRLDTAAQLPRSFGGQDQTAETVAYCHRRASP